MKMLLAAIFLLLSTPAFAQDPPADKPRYEFFGGYAVNADYVKNRPLILAMDQKVSPFFSLGSGPYGFDFSVKRIFRNGLDAKVDFSGYHDQFPPGKGTLCQASGCITNLPAQATSKTFYLTSGVEWKMRRDKKFAPFVEALGGIVFSGAKFSMSGSDSGQPISGGVLLASTTNTLTGGTVSYSDSIADTGWTLSTGAGFDVRLNKRLSYRLSLDYDPTFLVRPVYRDPVVDSQGRVALSEPTPSARARQDHARITMGMVWKFH
jgi:hypothetical protein